jgi:hypothetical protein
MPTPINELASQDSVLLNDSLPFYSTQAGETRRFSFANLLAWFKANFTDGQYKHLVKTPGDGFSLSFEDTTLNQYMIIRPTGSIATGTINLPSSSNLVDGQEIMATTKLAITALTVNGNGATEVNGAPTTLGANGGFVLRYDSETESWYLKP